MALPTQEAGAEVRWSAWAQVTTTSTEKYQLVGTNSFMVPTRWYKYQVHGSSTRVLRCTDGGAALEGLRGFA